jgi:hypothetical protein
MAASGSVSHDATPTARQRRGPEASEGKCDDPDSRRRWAAPSAFYAVRKGNEPEAPGVTPLGTPFGRASSRRDPTLIPAFVLYPRRQRRAKLGILEDST